MSAVHELRIKSPAGVLRAVITDYRSLSYTKEVNAPGELRFALDGTHAAIAYMERDAQVELWRANPDNNIDWYCDFYGFWRAEERQADADGLTTYVGICPGQMDLLRRVIVGYPAGADLRSTFTDDPGETVLKNLVKYNATSLGTTADGRKRDVSLQGVSVQADGGGGETISYACAFQTLLTALQDVAPIAGGDFDLIRTGAQAWEFRWYAGQRGTDRSASVTFALQYGNMVIPVLTRDYSREATIAVVGGQGEDDSRSVVIVQGANYGTATYRNIEAFVDARQFITTAGLAAAGSASLEQMRAIETLNFDVVQSPSTLYGFHYALGDLVTGYYQGVTATKQISRVTVSVETGGDERIDIETEAP